MDPRLVEPSMTIRATQASDSNWVEHHQQCIANGTLERVSAALDRRAAVRIKRSSGAWQECRLVGWGHAGRSWTVGWNESNVADDTRFKLIRLEHLLEWNPWLDACEDPADEEQTLEWINRYAGPIICKLAAEGAADMSDGELDRCLAECVAGRRLLDLARTMRDRGIVYTPDMADMSWDDVRTRLQLMGHWALWPEWNQEHRQRVGRS